LAGRERGKKSHGLLTHVEKKSLPADDVIFCIFTAPEMKNLADLSFAKEHLIAKGHAIASHGRGI